MKKIALIRTFFLAGMALGSSASFGEILTLPSGELSVTQSTASPQRGERDEDVLTRFGEPLLRHAAVGLPAISSWEYPTFRVYFENGVVIHAVQQSL